MIFHVHVHVHVHYLCWLQLYIVYITDGESETTGGQQCISLPQKSKLFAVHVLLYTIEGLLAIHVL